MERMTRLGILYIFAISGIPAQFLQKPYLQFGNTDQDGRVRNLTLLWHTEDQDQAWSIEWKAERESRWHGVEADLLRRISVRGVTPHRVYRAEMTNLSAGETVVYRVLLNRREVFSERTRAPKRPDQPHSFVVVGDTAEGSKGQKMLAGEIFKAKPDYFSIVGDIVYSRGLISQYYENYFPVYNCDENKPGTCAPLLRSVASVAIPGNHDIGRTANLGFLPDALAFFYYWFQPLNSPVAERQGPHVPKLKGARSIVQKFYDTAAEYPRMTMFSFDYGDVHWTMLDSNSYVDWSDPKLAEWVRQDLRSAKDARWRFVGQHHPAFSSSRKHSGDQWMRRLAPVFEEGKVDVVFAGHVHNYQRSLPLRFQMTAVKGNRVDGTFQLDREFDGERKTVPNGIIWIVTGGGGANLKDERQENNPSSWKEFTAKFISRSHSFTSVTVSGGEVLVRQISEDGREVDRFRVTR